MNERINHFGESVPLWPLILNYRIMARSTRFPNTRLFWRRLLKRVIAEAREQRAASEHREAA